MSSVAPDWGARARASARMNGFTIASVAWPVTRPDPGGLAQPPGFDVGLPLVHAAWPVFLEQPGHSTVGQEFAAGLTGWTVVALVVGVDDVLHGGAAYRTRLAELSVHGHLRMKGCHLRRELVTGLSAQPPGPRVECVPDGSPETRDLVRVETRRQLQRREPGGVQDLVGVGIADAAEKRGVRERAFDGVVL